MKKKSKNQWIQIAFVILSFSGVPVMAQATSPTTPPPVTTPAGENAPGPWAVAAIQLMIQKGLFIGYLDGSYDWTKPMTRQEAAVMIARFIEKYGLDKFNPEEIAVMQSAITELQKALLATEEKLQKQILELQRQIGGVQQFWVKRRPCPIGASLGQEATLPVMSISSTIPMLEGIDIGTPINKAI
jgi:hypothetical protein